MKIKQFINEKPKLKKSLKIVQLILAIWGVILTILLSVGLCLSNKEIKAPLVYSNQQKPTQEAIDFTNGYYIFGTNVITSTSCINRAVALNNYFFTNGATGADFYFNIYESVEVSIQRYQDVNFSGTGSIDTTSPYYFKFNALRFHIDIFGLGHTATRNISVYPYNASTNTQGSKLVNFDYIIPNYTQGSQATGFISNIINTTSNLCICINKNMNPGMYSFLALDGGSDNYNYGYADGYNVGYQNGYQEGYNSGSTGMTSNPFNLIKNAFEAIGGILNIQVLPHLSLGVLIFAPLTIVIIIAIVKMFRG